MIKFVEDFNKPKERELVRISSDENQTKAGKNSGKTASFILKALILDNKEVYLIYLSGFSNAKELSNKVIRTLAIANRMLKESLPTVCGGTDKVPEQYKDKKLKVFAGLPYDKNTKLSTVVNKNGQIIKTNNVIHHKDGSIQDTARSTIIKLHLAVEE